MRVIVSIAFVIAVAASLVMLSRAPSSDLPMAGQFDRYFPTPSAAVKTTAALMKEKKWSELAAYYDLSGSLLQKDDLASETFFVESEKLEDGLPEETERYKQPFTPGFKYQSARYVGEDLIEVTVMTEFQAEDETVQRGLETFLLKAHPEGYQLIPKDD